MNTKHTPGPWRFHHNEGQTFNFITDKYNNCIAKALINEHHIPADVAEENARLIAAAPELLEALKNILADVEYSEKEIPAGAIGQRQIRAAKAAIQKATNQ